MIWDDLKQNVIDKKRPFFSLAPMEDVTDTVFRRIILECGAPDLFYTEFVSCDGLCSPGRKKVGQRLLKTDIEKPLIAQIWGIHPEKFEEAAAIVVEMGFDGIDINFGCPVDKIIKAGACSATIDNPDLAKQIIEATKKGAGELPVSVKTRLGFKNWKTDEWPAFLFDCGIDQLTIHGRIASEMSKFPARWDLIGEVVKIRDLMGVKTVVTGNGDIKSYQQGLDMYERYGVDGIMIGRGIFENPWVFNPEVDPELVTKEERIKLLLKHSQLFNEVWGNNKNFQIMKKFFKVYLHGFEGAAELRAKLMECETLEEVEKVVEK